MPIPPAKTSHGRDVVPMTDEQKYIFDVRGWLLIPGVLGPDECEAAKEHIYKLHNEPDTLDPLDRNAYGNPTQELLDHPVVVGVLNEILAHAPNASEEGYGFRVDGAFTTIRKPGHDPFSPHGGGGFYNFIGNSHTYQALPGRINSGLTRVVWELNPVAKSDGATMMLSGSHKAAMPKPEQMQDRDWALWDRYECPAGSVLFFTEALTHSGAEWKNKERDRVAVFNCYNTVASKFHHGGPSREQIEAMPPLRRSLFRGVWNWAGGQNQNTTYDGETNFAF